MAFGFKSLEILKKSFALTNIVLFSIFPAHSAFSYVFLQEKDNDENNKIGVQDAEKCEKGGGPRDLAGTQRPSKHPH